MALATRRIARYVFDSVERWYGRKSALRPLGPILLLGRQPYRGAPRSFADGTCLTPEQPIGVLHFNNLRIADLNAGSRQRAGVQFARLFRESLQKLADRSQRDPTLSDVMVYHGLTWFKEHGDRVGFSSEPMPSGWRRWLLCGYFRLLSWGFSPVEQRRTGNLNPRLFWITRTALIKHFGTDGPDSAERQR